MKKTYPAASDSVDAAAETRLAELMEKYLECLERGEKPSREEYLARYPEFAETLETALNGLDFLNQAKPRVQGPDIDTSDSLTNRPVTLGDFRIIREIGRGGMGVVYEAEQVSLARRMAIKVLPFAAFFDQRHRARFQNEARAAAMLKHPNIVNVHSIGCERGVHFFAMEMIEGQSLASVIESLCKQDRSLSNGRDGAVDGDDVRPKNASNGWSTETNDTSPTAALSTAVSDNPMEYCRSIARLAIQAADALDCAHQCGIVHRDVKPSNLLVDDSGHLWVADFGLAALPEKTDLTRSGDLTGTLRYMSPEQATGQHKRMDYRTDIYSLGATIYELLTLCPAFPELDRHRLLRQIENHDPPAPRSINHSIPRDLETIVLRAMHKDAEARYDSAEALAADLRRFVDNKPILARKPTRRDQVIRWSRRNPVIATLLTLVLALSMAFAISASAVSVRFSRQAEELARLAEERRNQLYDADMNRIPALLGSGEYLRGISLLNRHIPVGDEIDLRGMEWYWYRRQCEAITSGRTLKHGLFVYCGEYSPDGKILATAGYGGQIHLWDASTHQHLRELKAHARSIRSLVFRNNSELISASEDGTVAFWDVRSGDKLRERSVNAELPNVLSLALSADGNMLAAGHCKVIGIVGVEKSNTPAGVSVWNLDSYERIAELDGFTGRVDALAFSTDGGSLFVGDETGALQVWKTTDWKLDRTINAHRGAILCLALSSDGRRLATGSGLDLDGELIQGEIKIWDTEQWNEIQSLVGHDNAVRCLDFDDDGTLVAGSNDGAISLWNIETTGMKLSFPAHSAEIISVRFAPDGDRICSTGMDFAARTWDVATLFETFRSSKGYRGHGGAPIVSVKLIKEGQTACSLDRYGYLHVWDTVTHVAQSYPADFFATLADMDVSPDERLCIVGKGHYPAGEHTAILQLFDLTNEDAVNPKLIWQHELKGGFQRGVEFSPNGDFLALGTGRTFQVRSVDTGEVDATYGPLDERTRCVRYSGDGTRVACTTLGGSTYVFRASDLHLLRRIQTDSNVTFCVEFSPDGQHILTGGGDNVIKKWDAESFDLIQRFQSCSSWVTRLLYSSEGDRVISTTINGTVQIWRSESGVSVFRSSDKESVISLNLALSTNPDGGSVFAFGAGNLRVWSLPGPDTVFHQPTIEELEFGGCQPTFVPKR